MEANVHEKAAGVTDPVIMAAGGIVWLREPAGPVVALVHRVKYNDWTLPKGKFDQDRDRFLEHTAVREVREETSCSELRMRGFAGTTRYSVKDANKLVFFWHMVARSKPSFRPTNETDRLEWLPPEEACSRLTHDQEKELVRVAALRLRREPGMLDADSVSRSRDMSEERLDGALAAYRLELAERIARAVHTGQSEPSWVPAAQDLLAETEAALADHQVDCGWKCFMAAQRMELYGLDEDELRARARLFLLESEKLSSWRRAATEELLKGRLGDDPRSSKPLSHERVYQAALIRDEHFSNEHLKIGQLKSLVRTLAWVLGALTAVLVAGLLLTPFNPAPPVRFEPLGVLLFGILGGALSASFSIGRTPLKARIPELTTGFTLLSFRVLVGGASALVVYTFLRGGLADLILSKEIASFFREPSTTSVYVILLVSAAAGVGERLVLRSLNLVARGGDSKGA